MSAISDLDLEKLLQSIASDHPSGEDVRTDSSQDSVYYRIKAARSEARSVERRFEYGDAQIAEARPYWQTVLDLVSDALVNKTKDLELSAYLIEALIRIHGFVGLHQGFRVVRGFVEDFWETLYPLPDRDGLETRIAYMTGLNGSEKEGTLIRPIMMCPITGGPAAAFCSTADYNHAQLLSRLEPDELEQRIQDGEISMDAVEQAAAETSVEFFVENRSELRRCLEEYEKMCDAFDGKCGTAELPTSNIRTALEDCLKTIDYIAGPEVETVQSLEPADQTAASSLDSVDNLTSGSAANATGPIGLIRTREDALNALAEIAKFYRRAEPHSPMSYAAEQLTRWGRMQLPELLQVLVPDQEANLVFRTLTGMGTPPDESSAHGEEFDGYNE